MTKKIFWLKEEDFIKRLEALPYANASKHNIKNAYLNFISFMIREKYILDEKTMMINADQIDDIVQEYINEKDSFGLKSIYRSYLKPIFNLHSLEFDREKYNILNYADFKDVSNNFLTEEELKNELGVVYNASDKLIIYMAYLNIIGKDFENVSYAEKDDVDFKTEKWVLFDGNVIDLKNDVLLKQLLKETLEQNEFIPYIKFSSNGNIPDFYEYNIESKYLFRTRKHPRTKNGLAPISKEGVKKIFIRLTGEFGRMFTRNNLKISRVLNTMYEKNPSSKWKFNDIKILKNELNVKFTETDIRIFYLQKYFPESLSEIEKK